MMHDGGNLGGATGYTSDHSRAKAPAMSTCSEATDMISASAPTMDDEPSLKSHVRTSAIPPLLAGALPRCTAAHTGDKRMRLDDLRVTAAADGCGLLGLRALALGKPVMGRGKASDMWPHDKLNLKRCRPGLHVQQYARPAKHRG